MKSTLQPIFKYLAVIPMLFILFSFMMPIATNAQGRGGNSPQEASDVNIEEVTLENPLNGINSIEGLLVALLNIIMVLMVPVIVFFIIYAGFKYVMAQGNAREVEEATRALTYAIIGGVLILGAVAISQIIKSVVDAF